MFTVNPAGRQDLFATLDALAVSLETPGTTAVERTRQQNAIFVALANVSAAQDHFIDQRAAGGARQTRTSALRRSSTSSTRRARRRSRPSTTTRC